MRTKLLLACLLTVLSCPRATPQDQNQRSHSTAATTYLGFDRNEYPGDQNLAGLRRTFHFTSYWLNNPPGSSRNTWKGKRRLLLSAGFGFLVVFNGRLYAELAKRDANAIGARDAAQAIRAARAEGFGRHTVIFLDQEQGGRMLPEQRAYLHAWIDAINAAGFQAGVYCSGIPFKEPDGTVVITAEDIRSNAQGREIVYWVTGDQCPPSPGCSFPLPAPPVRESGVEFATVWQYAQSPRRPALTKACKRTYHADGNCYPPDLAATSLHVDLDTATSADPSRGRGQ